MSENQEMNDYGVEGNVRFLRARAFQRDLPKRQFPFRFKITDIEGGEILPPEPIARLVTDHPIQDQVSFPKRLRRWVSGFFGSREVVLPADGFNNRLTKDHIKRILAMKGIRP